MREGPGRGTLAEMDRFIIGQRPPLYFMHIPKTAGTSMRRFLADQYRPGEVCPATDWYQLARSEVEAADYPLIQGHFNFSLGGLAGSRKSLTILRHPLNRTLSALRHLQRDPNFHPLHARAKDMTIGEMLRDPELFRMHRNGQTGHLAASANPNAILTYLREGMKRDERRDPADLEDPPDLAVAVRNLERIDFIGLTEQFDEFLPAFCDEMGFHPAAHFRQDNDAPDGVSDFHGLSPEEIGLLSECNDLDLELYAHAERLIAQRREERQTAAVSTKEAIARLYERRIYGVPRGSFEIDLAGPVPGSSWYEPEFEDGKVLRWTGPFPEFTLELPLRAHAQYRVTLRFYSARPFEPRDFTVRANELVLPVQLDRRKETYTVMFDIPQFLVIKEDGFCQLVFEIPSVFRPSDSGAPDERKLGVGVSSVVFERLN